MKSDRNELNLKGKSEIFCSLLIVVMSDKNVFMIELIKTEWRLMNRCVTGKFSEM
jgi:hypothetical protein